MGTTSRRTFLEAAGGAVLATAGFPGILPLSAQAAPSNRITLGFVGVGDHGTAVNLTNMLGHGDVQVLAVCDVDPRRLEKAEGLVTRHYADSRPSGVWKGCAAYQDFRAIIARDDIDAVVVSTPDHWHVPVSMAAIRAGKDVYCEKPLTLTVAQGRTLSDAVRRYGRVFQTGSEFRGQANFHRAAELVRNGRIGTLHTIRTYLPGGHPHGKAHNPPMPVPEGFDYDMWLGPAPWAPYTEGRCHWNFRWISDYSGGQLTDWGGHLNDQAQWGNDTEYTGPVAVEGRGVFPATGLYDTATDFHVTYRYANGVTLICTSQPRELAGSIRYEGTEGAVFTRYGGALEASPRSVLDSVIGPEETHLYTCREGPERNFLDCVKTRRPTYYPAEVGHRSATVCHLGNIALLLGRKLRWDPAEERFVGDEEADRMLSRTMRAPWSL